MYYSKKIKLLVLLGFLAINLSWSQRLTNRDVEAKIDTSSINGVYQLKSAAYNKTEEYKSLKYDFSVIKKNRITKNTVKNRQEGLFVLDPSQTLTLSNITVNLDTNDEVVVFLLIYEEEKLVGKTILEIGKKDIKKEKKILEKEEKPIIEDVDVNGEDGVEIRGLVTDDTITKFGREFYEFFANMNREDNINAAQVIIVEEKFSLGRRTIVDVKIAEQLVYQFLVKPDVEFLQSNADTCIRYVKSYLEREKRNAKQIKEY